MRPSLHKRTTSLLTLCSLGTRADWMRPLLPLTFASLKNIDETDHDYAGVVELVDAGDSKSPGLYACAGSTPASGTNKNGGFRRYCPKPPFLFEAAWSMLSPLCPHFAIPGHMPRG